MCRRRWAHALPCFACVVAGAPFSIDSAGEVNFTVGTCRLCMNQRTSRPGDPQYDKHRPLQSRTWCPGQSPHVSAESETTSREEIGSHLELLPCWVPHGSRAPACCTLAPTHTHRQRSPPPPRPRARPTNKSTGLTGPKGQIAMSGITHEHEVRGRNVSATPTSNMSMALGRPQLEHDMVLIATLLAHLWVGEMHRLRGATTKMKHRN